MFEALGWTICPPVLCPFCDPNHVNVTVIYYCCPKNWLPFIFIFSCRLHSLTSQFCRSILCVVWYESRGWWPVNITSELRTLSSNVARMVAATCLHAMVGFNNNNNGNTTGEQCQCQQFNCYRKSKLITSRSLLEYIKKLKVFES